MDEEELAKVAELLASQMVEKFPVLNKEAETVVEEKETTPKDNNIAPFDMKAMVTEMMTQLNQRDDSKVMNVMFQDKLNQAMAQTPGFEEYLNDKDDYGRVRMEQITQGSYEDKLAILDSVQKSFVQASSNNGGRPPVVSEKVSKRVKETETKYEDIDKKLETGAYGSIQEFADDYFEIFDAEMTAIQ